ncbi:MAG: ABC transporter substrate-binding protein [Bacillota bacterium]|nr:ABC transporter substrate-binding protein [Bacillota bacterium]
MKKISIKGINIKKRIISLVSLVVLVLASFTGCGASSKDTTADKGGKKLFPIRVATQTGFNEFDVATALGYFKEEGIEIKYTGVLQAGTSEVQTVVAGSNDVFTGHPSTVAKAVLAGAKIKIVSPGMVDNANFVHMDYMVRKDGPIQSAEDLKKRKVKVAVAGTGSCSDLIALEWAKKNGIPEENLEFVLMPEAQQEQAVTQGLVDIANLHPVSYKKAHADGKLKTLFTSWEVVGSPAAGSSIRGFSDKFIKEHPDVVRGFIRALYKAHVYINSHQKESIDIVAKALDKDPSTLATFWYDENKKVQDSYVQTWLDLMKAHGQLKSTDSIKASDIYTNEYNDIK